MDKCLFCDKEVKKSAFCKDMPICKSCYKKYKRKEFVGADKKILPPTEEDIKRDLEALRNKRHISFGFRIEEKR